MNNSFKIVSVVSLVVGLIALVTAAVGHNQSAAPVPADQNAGGVYNVNNVAPTFTDGIDLGNQAVRLSWEGGTIGSKLTSSFWRNTKSATATVDYVEMRTSGIASSTFKLWAFATSTLASETMAFKNNNTFTNINAAALGSLLINGKQIATTSAATTTSSDDNGVPQAGSSYMVPPGGYLDFLITGCTAGYQGGTANCDTASSSNRGFNVNWVIEYHY